MSSQIDAVKNAIDIVALVGERVKLTRAGKNYKGLCPFHGEKSPSFFVTPELGRYKCFGCQEAGDAFTFLEKMDGLTFAQALQELAKRAGITLESVPFTQEDKKRERQLALLSLAKEYYHYILVHHQIAAPAREYLSERGISNSTLELFGLGYSPNSWDSVQAYLIGKKNFTQQELLDVGLIIKNDRGRVYDRFRGRLMFPLTTHRGEVVGFSGRTLEKDAKEAKYINSPETSLYHKSELLFGYSQLSSFIRKSEEVILCEGEFDALSSMQSGVENVVAIKGSALTQEQIKLLARTVKRVIFALDADKAGIEATKRAIQLVKENKSDLNLRVIQLTGGKDPDELARHDPKRWREMVQSSVSVYEYLITVSFAKNNPLTGDGKREISKELAPLLSGISNAVERAHYIALVAKKLQVSEDVFLDEMRKVKLPVIQPNQAPSGEKKMSYSRRDILERYILLLLFAAFSREDSKTTSWVGRIRSQVTFSSPWKEIFAAFVSNQYGFDISAIVQSLPTQFQDSASTLYLEASELAVSFLSDEELIKALHEHGDFVQKETMKKRIERIGELEAKTTLTPEEEDEIHTLRMDLVS